MNYGGNGGHECQLLAANKFESSEQMTIDNTFQHFSVAVSEIFVLYLKTFTGTNLSLRVVV